MRRILAVALLGLVVLALTAAGGAAAPSTTSARGMGLDLSRSYGERCRAASTPVWHRVLARHIVPLSRVTSLSPFALAPDGRSFFAAVHSRHGFSGVARIDGRSGRVTKIKAFSRPRLDQVTGAFDGRFLVWTVWPGQAEAAVPWTVWAWDSLTGRLWRIGAAERGQNGVWNSGGMDPDVRSGIATWAQGPNDVREIHLYDLRARRDSVIRPRHSGWPLLLDGHLVVWSALLGHGAKQHWKVYAASTTTGAPAQVPRALRGPGVADIISDGHAVVLDRGSRSLWWSPSLRQPPRKVLQTHGVHYIDASPAIGGGYIGFGIQPSQFLADPKTGRYVRLEHGFGWTLLNTRALLIDYGNNTKKTLNYRAHIVLIPLRDLPAIATCR